MSILKKNKSFKVQFCEFANYCFLVDFVCEHLQKQMQKKPNLILGWYFDPVFSLFFQKLSLKKWDFSYAHSFILGEFIQLKPSLVHLSQQAFLQKHLFSFLNIPYQNQHNLVNATTLYNPQISYSAYDCMLQSYGGIDWALIYWNNDGEIIFNSTQTALTSKTHCVAFSKEMLQYWAQVLNCTPQHLSYGVCVGLGTLLSIKQLFCIITKRRWYELLHNLQSYNAQLLASFLFLHPNAYVLYAPFS